MKVKDLIQDLKRYNFDMDTNIKGIEKKNNEIIFKVEEKVKNRFKNKSLDELQYGVDE